MKRELYKIVGIYEDKRVTLKTVDDEAEAETERRRFAACFSSSWTIKVERSAEAI